MLCNLFNTRYGFNAVVKNNVNSSNLPVVLYLFSI